jgi:hypothetical protein
MIDPPSGLPAAAEGISRMKGFAMGVITGAPGVPGAVAVEKSAGPTSSAKSEGSIEDASTRLMERCYLPGSESALAFT